MPKRMPSLSILLRTTSIAGLLAVLLTLAGCFLFRSKPDDGAQQLTSRLSLGMSTEEVLSQLGPPQRRGNNLFDKKKEYWFYELASTQQAKKQKRAADRDGQVGPPGSEVQLVFERGKLLGWDHITRR